jgi:hypothetical protein
MKALSKWIVDPDEGVATRCLPFNKMLILNEIDFGRTQFYSRSALEATIYASRHFAWQKLIRCLQSPQCTVRCLQFNFYCPLVIYNLSLGEFPSITHVCLNMPIISPTLFALIISRRSSVTTIIANLSTNIFTASRVTIIDMLMEQGCKIKLITNPGGGGLPWFQRAITIRMSRKTLCAICSTKVRVGTLESALQRLDRVLVRYLGTFLV